MLRPVKDPCDRNHFLKAQDVRRHIDDNNLSFTDLQNELPELKSRSDTRAEFNADVLEDKKHSKLLHESCVRDIVFCDQCKFPRCIYSEFVLHSKKWGVSKETQDKRWNKLQQWKENGFVCGNAPTVKPYVTKQQLRCRDHVESMYYESIGRFKGAHKILCSFCCSEEDVLTSEEVKKQQTNLKGSTPLPLCRDCIQHKVEAPTMRGTRNFVDAAKQHKAGKAAKHAESVAKGVRRPTKKRKS